MKIARLCDIICLNNKTVKSTRQTSQIFLTKLLNLRAQPHLLLFGEHGRHTILFFVLIGLKQAACYKRALS